MLQFVCQEAFSECNLANVGDSTAQRNCTTSIQDTCGTLDPAKYTAPSTATTSSATSSATGSSTSAAASSSATSTSASTAGAPPTNLHRVGAGAAAAALGLVVYML